MLARIFLRGWDTGNHGLIGYAVALSNMVADGGRLEPYSHEMLWLTRHWGMGH